ncbi:MAG TPA: histone deacetylase [Candidatus Acidoferrales bacterium]|nr:histone deacetylase [Candidatus Acidoferrales bacterium]
MPVPPLIYHDRYDLHLGSHVFPSQKYRLVRDALIANHHASAADIIAPAPASDEDILRVHTPAYVHKLKTGTLAPHEILRMEIPYSNELIDAVWLAAGGSIEAARRALALALASASASSKSNSLPVAVNIGGGFHHAFPDHGEGFCVIHDVAVAIRRLQHDRAIRTAMVIDTDVHHGNGTAAIFARDPSVFTFSIHQEHNYPEPKPPSSLDANLPDGIGDEHYLSILDAHLSRAFREFHPDLIFYVAGADPYCEDQLGGLSLTIEGLRRRDALVFDYAHRHRVPIAITLAGGYARQVADTVKIHVNTILAASMPR